jgi:antitoxin VapB
MMVDFYLLEVEMGLNIKNADVEADIRKLAEITGESLTTAIQGAVREKIARLKQAAVPSDTLGEYLAAIRPLQEALKARQLRPDDQRTARELIDDLYDEHGLPK